MFTRVSLYFTLVTLLTIASVQAVGVNISKNGVQSLPEHAVLLDNHRYFYIEEIQRFDRGKRDMLRITIRVGNNYNLGGFSLTNAWQIGNESHYLFKLMHGKKNFHASSQFNIEQRLETAMGMSIDVSFMIDKDLKLEDLTLFFTGRPSKAAKTRGAALVPPPEATDDK